MQKRWKKKQQHMRFSFFLMALSISKSFKPSFIFYLTFRDFIASIIRGIYMAPNRMNDNSTCAPQISCVKLEDWKRGKETDCTDSQTIRKTIIQRLHICCEAFQMKKKQEKQKKKQQ